MEIEHNSTPKTIEKRKKLCVVKYIRLVFFVMFVVVFFPRFWSLFVSVCAPEKMFQIFGAVPLIRHYSLLI